MDPQMYTSMEVEYDSDEDLQDVGTELNTWLAQLDTGNSQTGDEKGGKTSLITQSHTMESFRYSVVMDMDGGGNCGDLDDIINDLCALEAELADAQKEFHTVQPLTDGDSGNVDDMYSPNSQTIEKAKTPTTANSTIPPPSFHVIKVGTTPQFSTISSRPQVPDNTYPQSPYRTTTEPRQHRGGGGGGQLTPSSADHSADRDQRAKEEKIRIAIQKIKAADIKKLFVKVFIQNGECKTILVDEKMSVSEVLLSLYEKCEVKPNVRWTLVEQIPDLFIERIIEDHEKLISMMMNWQKISNNKILFLETDDKYDLFFQPQRYLLNRERAEKCVEKEQRALLDELFGGAGTHVPEMEGDIYHKIDGQKTWKKITVVLRTSGIYCKKGKSSRNLQCITSFDQVEIYRGFGWKKKYKAPTEHCFALKHPKLQKKSKDMRYFCCEDEYTLKKWLMGMRVAKYGKELHYGFRGILDIVGGNRKPSAGAVDTPSDSMSQSSRDSGFSVTSDSSNSLDIAQSSAKKQRNGVIPSPPDEFSDLPPPPPELLTEEPTPTNTPVHFAQQLNDDFNSMHIQYNNQSSEDDNQSGSNSSVCDNTPRNSVTSTNSVTGTPVRQQSFERCSGIRNSLRKGQSPKPPKLVAPPKVPQKVIRCTLPQPPLPVQTMHSQANHSIPAPQSPHHYYGHYGSQFHQPPTSASSLSLSAPLPPPPTAAKHTNHNGHFLAELNHLYARKGQPASSESDSDVDDLPPPPPELLDPNLNGYTENAYDVPVPYNQRSGGVIISAVSNGIYSIPPPPLEYNPYSDRRGGLDSNAVYGQASHGPSPSHEPYSMSRVFASQTGTIKRAPPPPKRNNSISTLQRNGSANIRR